MKTAGLGKIIFPGQENSKLVFINSNIRFEVTTHWFVFLRQLFVVKDLNLLSTNAMLCCWGTRQDNWETLEKWYTELCQISHGNYVVYFVVTLNTVDIGFHFVGYCHKCCKLTNRSCKHTWFIVRLQWQQMVCW